MKNSIDPVECVKEFEEIIPDKSAVAVIIRTLKYPSREEASAIGEFVRKKWGEDVLVAFLRPGEKIEELRIEDMAERGWVKFDEKMMEEWKRFRSNVAEEEDPESVH